MNEKGNAEERIEKDGKNESKWMDDWTFGRDCVNISNRGTTGFHRQTKHFELLYKTIKAGKIVQKADQFAQCLTLDESYP